MLIPSNEKCNFKNTRSSRPEVLYEKDVLRNFTKFHSKTPVPGSLFSCEFCEISKVTFSYGTPSVAASKMLRIFSCQMHRFSGCLYGIKKPSFLPLLIFTWRTFSRRVYSTLVTSVSKKSSVDQSELEKQMVSDCKTDYTFTQLTFTCSKLTIKTPKRRQWRHSGVFIFNFEHILHLFLVILLLTLNKYMLPWKEPIENFCEKLVAKNSYLFSQKWSNMCLKGSIISQIWLLLTQILRQF